MSICYSLKQQCEKDTCASDGDCGRTKSSTKSV